jgi:hypothetical protein
MWPFRKRTPQHKPLLADKVAEAEAHRALELSQKALDRAVDRGSEVDSVIEKIRQLRPAEDLFGELIQESMRPRRRRWRAHHANR